MCNCKTEILEKVKKSIGVNNGCVDYELISGKTYTNFRYNNEKGKEKTVPILNSFCPFCGKKY